MPATLTSVDQIAQAVYNARHARHHQDCRCANWRDTFGAPFCSPLEKRWEDTIDRLIDRARMENQ